MSASGWARRKRFAMPVGYLGTSEIAGLLGVSTRLVRLYLARGLIPGAVRPQVPVDMRRSGDDTPRSSPRGHWAVPIEQVDRFLSSGGLGPGSLAARVRAFAAKHRSPAP